jgi:hypothetical protein
MAMESIYHRNWNRRTAAQKASAQPISRNKVYWFAAVIFVILGCQTSPPEQRQKNVVSRVECDDSLKKISRSLNWKDSSIEIEGHCVSENGTEIDNKGQRRLFFSGTRRTLTRCPSNADILLFERFENGTRNGDLIKEKGDEIQVAKFKDGSIVGTARRYRKEGQPIARVDYAENIPSGEYVQWYANGIIKEKTIFVLGEPTDMWRFRENGMIENALVRIDGSRKSKNDKSLFMSWDQNGKLLELSHFYCGNPCRINEFVGENIQSATFDNDGNNDCPVNWIIYNDSRWSDLGIPSNPDVYCRSDYNTKKASHEMPTSKPLTLICEDNWFAELEMLADCSSNKHVWESIDAFWRH